MNDLLLSLEPNYAEDGIWLIIENVEQKIRECYLLKKSRGILGIGSRDFLLNKEKAKRLSEFLNEILK